MMKALCFDRFGGPDVLQYRELPMPTGDAVVRMRAIGLNYADVYRREGHYTLDGPSPWIAGYEGAGVLEDGTRVGFADVPRANATHVLAPRDRLIPLPDDVSDETAAAVLLQGLTAQYLVRDSHPVCAGETVVIHAAAGGVGTLLTQLVARQGATAIALVSSAEKAAWATAHGAARVVTYAEDWVAEVKGADVVYDSVGSTLLQSLAAARDGGHVVYYGKAGGTPPPLDVSLLMDRSLRVTGGDLWNVLSSQQERLRRAHELFGWLRDGSLRLEKPKVFGLAEGAAAHALLQSRRSVGKIILVP